MKIIKFFILCFICMIIIACQAGSSNQSMNSTNDMTASVSMGHIGIIPTGNGSSGKSSIKITNNLDKSIRLTSATYSIIQNGINDAPHSASEYNSPVDTSQCHNINAQSDCDIIVSAQNESEFEYILNLTYSSSGKLFPLISIVEFSNSIPDINGVRYSIPNTNLNNQLGNSTSITIPFQLTKTTSIKLVATTDNNSVFTPRIDCPGNNELSSYPAGTLCNLYIKVTDVKEAESIQGNIKVELAFVDQSKKVSTKGNSSYLLNVPITVNKTLSGNLLVSSTNIVIESANGSVSKTITLLNNGSAIISNLKISVQPNSALSIPTNNCTQINPQSGCTFAITANSTISSQESITLSYDDGNLSTDPKRNLYFNVIYTAPSKTPFLSIEPQAQSNFTNTLTNSTRSYSISLKNKGETRVNNIKFIKLPSQFAYSNDSTCNLSGNTSLEPGGTCNLIVNYTPIVATTSATNQLNIQAGGSYYNNGPQSYNTPTVQIQYNAIESVVQAITITPNPVMMKFNESQNLLLNLIYSTGLTIPIAYDPSLTFSSSDPTVVYVVAARPSLVPTSPLPGTLTSLSKNGTAVVTATYGAGTTNQVIAKFNVTVNSSYKPSGIYILQNMGINNGYSLFTSAFPNISTPIAFTLIQSPSILLSQEFYITGNKGVYNFKLVGSSGLCIDLSNNNGTVGSSINQYGCNGSTAQSINILTSQATIPDTGILVQIKINGGCVSGRNGSNNNAPLIWDNCAAYTTKSEQYWKLIRVQ